MEAINITNQQCSLNTVCDGINNSDYHKYTDLLKSPWLYDYNKNNPKPQTAAMAFGSLVHYLILEPKNFEQYYFVADQPKKNTRDGKAAYHRLD